MIIQSILVYFLLLSLMMFFFYLAYRKTYHYNEYALKSQNNNFWIFEIVFPILIFSLIFGMRYDVGTDHLSYLDYYLSKFENSKFEYLFSLITKISWKLNLHFVFYFTFLAFLSITFFFLAFRKELYLFPILIFFLFMNGNILFWMNGIRQSIAMCIWIYSLNYIADRKLLKYILFGIVAFLFHRSAIILFVLYPILVNGRDYFKNIPLQLTLLASAFTLKEFFYDNILKLSLAIDFYISLLGAEMYENNYNIDGLLISFREDTGTGLAYLWRIFINVVIIIYSLKLKKYYNSRWFNIVYFLFFIGLITSYIFPNGLIAFTRPFAYFYIFNSIMFAYFTYYLYKHKSIINDLLYYFIIISIISIFIFNQFISGIYTQSLFKFYFQYIN